MPGEERLLHENAALVALLNTVDNKKGRHLDIHRVEGRTPG